MPAWFRHLQSNLDSRIDTKFREEERVNPSQPLAFLGLHLAILLQPNRLDLDEATGLIRLEAADLVHRALLLVIQLLGLAAPTEYNGVALVQAQTDLAVDRLLGRDDAGLEELALGGEIQAVVEDAGVGDGDELVAEGADFTVERQAFDVDVGVAEDREARGLVAASGFDADESVLDDVDSADAVLAGEGVGREEELGGVGLGSR